MFSSSHSLEVYTYQSLSSDGLSNSYFHSYSYICKSNRRKEAMDLRRN